MPIRKEVTSKWFGHEGGAYFRENIEVTGLERDNEDTCKPPKGQPGQEGNWYHDYYFTSGLETVAMMIEFVKFSNDLEFKNNVLLPFAREVLLFFDLHYGRDEHQQLSIDPGMVLETFWKAQNPTPDVAGLRYCLEELIDMDCGLVDDLRSYRRFLKEIPEISLRSIDGTDVIAPAKSYSKLRNMENGELYAAFPFKLVGKVNGSEALLSKTMEHRLHKNSFDYACWGGQDQVWWALAGEAKKAAEGLELRFRNASDMCRFPLYGKENPDSCPDFDHFGVGVLALQYMIAQEKGDKIYLLPAWPKYWDVDFKIHLSKETIVEGKVIDGKLEGYKVTPEFRSKDVVVDRMYRV